MKKTNIIETLDQSQPVELTTAFNGGVDGVLKITGDYETIIPLYEEARTREAQTPVTPPAESVRRAAKTIGAMLVPPAQQLAEKTRTDASALVYDIFNGTHFFRAVREKRQTEKNLRMAQNLGLIGLDVCAKHRKALADVNKMR